MFFIHLLYSVDISLFLQFLRRISTVLSQQRTSPLFSCSVTRCDSSLVSFCYSPVYFISRIHLHSGYYYYDHVTIGVLWPSWFTEILI